MLADFNKKSKRDFFNKQFLFKTLGIVFLLAVCGLILADFKIYQKKLQLASRVNAYQKRIEDIKKSSQTLKDEIVNQDNPDYLQKIAYEQLGEAKPGETVYSFISSPDKKKAIQIKSNNFWESWLAQLSGAWQWIKSKF